ncbi:Glycosyltransferase 61 [Dillenia turbinata]|uniref:Glycosyltransferase 61 n=1 Tax=Dillenia turbinata TaxID=194707 RepID=A0AAN8VP76_9MAGN
MILLQFDDWSIPTSGVSNSTTRIQEVVMVIDQSHDWWLNKNGDLLHELSKQRIIRMDQETTPHCFPWTLIGLISHGLGSINPKWLPISRTLHHFRDLLANAYGDQNRPFVSRPPNARPRPRLVLARRRRGGRVMLNYVEVKHAMEEAGFEVIEFEPTKTTDLHQNYALLSSSHALLGVHGAALTHLLFLRPGSVLLQIVLIGQDGVAEFFGKPARELGLEYMEYKISVYESSYMEKYGKDDLILNNSTALLKDGWNRELYELYIKYQDVKLDLTRFRPYLEKAYKKAEDFMDRLPQI